MAGPYSFVTRAYTTLAADMAVSATTATMASAVAGTPTFKMIVTVDGDIPAKAADFECTVTGTALTSMVLKNGPDVAHVTGCQVWFGVVDDHLSGLTDGSAFSLGASTVPVTAVTASAWTTFVPAPTGYSGSPTVNLARYQLIGKWMAVELDVTGTGTGTTLTFTIPFAAKSSLRRLSVSTDNGGTPAVSQINTTASSATVSAFPSLASNTWTNAAGVRAFLFSGVIEIA